MAMTNPYRFPCRWRVRLRADTSTRITTPVALWVAVVALVVPTLAVLCVPSVTGLVHEVEPGLHDGAAVDAV
jgi:hypothetical protein